MSSMRSASSRTRTRTDRERDEAPVEQVVEPARSRDEDLGAPRLLRLSADRRSTVDGGDAQVACCGERLQVGDDLGGELAGRYEHERARMPVGAGRPLDHRNAERERLAGACRRRGQDVDSGEGIAKDEAWIANGEVMPRRSSTPTMGALTPSASND